MLSISSVSPARQPGKSLVEILCPPDDDQLLRRQRTIIETMTHFIKMRKSWCCASLESLRRGFAGRSLHAAAETRGNSGLVSMIALEDCDAAFAARAKLLAEKKERRGIFQVVRNCDLTRI